ncbi:MAG TPA: imelysin family protein [Planctomycetota bacterium]|nr:imelysin family protein [Planctomycetota bacterium]
MASSRRSAARIVVAVGLATAIAAAQAAESAPVDLRRATVRGYADWCLHLYAACEEKARALDAAAAELVRAPSEATLAAARRAWIDGRRLYGLTEALRFYDGPIDHPQDGVETLVNAWPVDESYIDAVIGRPSAGIVHDVERFPRIGETSLTLANERGGEANVSVGWHAIEFLLWGQDLSADGPGSRPATDYVPGVGVHAERRGAYLRATAALLVRHLAGLKDAWAADADNYRRRFESDDALAVKRMLTGVVVLSGFEMAGERLAPAIETRDQEQEHSCFSDTTHLDFESNQAGVQAIFDGRYDDRTFGPGLLAWVRRARPDLADDLAKKLAASRAALAGLPQPFDRALKAAEGAPERRALERAQAALEEQADALAAVGRALGYDLPLKPGGS